MINLSRMNFGRRGRRVREIPSVTQATDKSTGVTLNSLWGVITMDDASLTGSAVFTVTNDMVEANDVVIVVVKSGGTNGAYQVSIAAVAAGSFNVVVNNITGGALGEAIVLSFAVLKPFGTLRKTGK